MLKEFREFITKGNVVDLAVAVVIGAAFAAIISSLVEDIITPLILTPALDAAGIKDISQLTWHNVKYGNFLAAVIKFLIIAFVLFLIVKSLKNFLKKEAPPAPTGPTQEELLAEIRDILKSRDNKI